jgi:putative drug exporter of the RND superfamily
VSERAGGRGLLAGLTRLAVQSPRRVLAATVLFLLAAGIFGVPVIKSLPAGGFKDPGSDSSRAAAVLANEFDIPEMQLIVTVQAEQGATSAAARTVGSELAATLSKLPYVAKVISAWTAPAPAAQSLVSIDGKTGLIVAGIRGGESEAQQHAKELTGLLNDRDGITVRAGGPVMNYLQANEQSEKDLLRMETIALPVTFIVLVWVFGGLWCAALPLAVAGTAVLGSLAALRLITLVTDVSVFALNLTIALGLALAVDYTLLIVSRFREEVASGTARDEALQRTMSTAGRTVFFSAMTVALALSALVLFPMYFLKSFAYAGVAVVALAAAASVVVTPAAIILLGDRLDSLDVRRWFSGPRGGGQRLSASASQTFWYRSVKWVMRRAVPVSTAVVALLLLLGAPFLNVTWGFSDDRVLPESASARQVGDELRAGFANDLNTNIVVVLPDVNGVDPVELDRYAQDLSRVPDVSAVSSPGGAFRDGRRVGPAVAPTDLSSAAAFLTVCSTAPLYSAASAHQLEMLRRVAPPGGRVVHMTGSAPINHDSSAGVTSRLPLVLAVVGAITAVLLFLLTGSVVLPLKALLLNVLSLSASFGALVWIFQDGHLGAFGTTATGTLMASIPVLMFCVAFGLSMDYEVFLVSRIREFWLSSGRGRLGNDDAIALGLARTGRVVTAAALLMVVAFGALISAQVSFMRMLGVGLTIAVVVDATLVRMLLLPAVMHLLGPLAWWAPRSLVRLHDKIGIDESAGRPPVAGPGLRPAPAVGDAQDVGPLPETVA